MEGLSNSNDHRGKKKNLEDKTNTVPGLQNTFE